MDTLQNIKRNSLKFIVDFGNLVWTNSKHSVESEIELKKTASDLLKFSSFFLFNLLFTVHVRHHNPSFDDNSDILNSSDEFPGKTYLPQTDTFSYNTFSSCLEHIPISKTVHLFTPLLADLNTNSERLKPWFMGDIYETFLSHNPVIENGRFKLKRTKKSPRKVSGSYFTPSEIINYIVKGAIGPYVKNMSLDQVLSIKILDPAMGTGKFLHHALDYLTDRFTSQGERNDIRWKIAQNCLYGIDIDPITVELAKLGMILHVHLSEKVSADLSDKLICGNTIVGSDFAPKEQPDRLSAVENEKFDIVIGNPPWLTVRHKELGMNLVDYFKKKYKSAGGFKLNLFPLFVERSIQMLAENGRFGMIVPNRILDTPSYAGCRKVILDDLAIDHICAIPSGRFKRVTAGNAIIIGSKNKPGRESDLVIKHYDDKKKKISVPLRFIQKDPLQKINIYLNPSYIPLMEKIDHNSFQLADMFDIHVGMMIKNRENVLSFEKTDENQRQIITSKDISPFKIFRKRYFNHDRIVIFGGTKVLSKHMAHPKIVLRKTGDRLLAALDTEGLFCEQSLYMLIPNKKTSIKKLKAICVLLNSPLLTKYFRNMLITNPDSYPYIQHYDAERIPISTELNDNSLNELEKIYNAIISQDLKSDEIDKLLRNLVSSLYEI